MLTQMMPPMARAVSLRWLRLLAKLSFLRRLYSHANAGLRPPWADAVLRLCEYVDSMTAVMRGISGAPEFESIVEPFSCSVVRLTS